MNAEDTASPALLTPDEVCQRLRVARSTLVRWEREGILRPVRIGAGTIRYAPSEIESFIAKGGTAPRFVSKGARA